MHYPPMSSNANETRKIRLAKGFVLHKMYHYGYTGGKHTSVDNLPKSCPLELRAHLNRAIKDLQRDGLLLVKPTSYGPQATALHSQLGCDIANAYLDHIGIKDFRHGAPLRPVQKALPLSKQELDALKSRKKKR